MVKFSLNVLMTSGDRQSMLWKYIKYSACGSTITKYQKCKILSLYLANYSICL